MNDNKKDIQHFILTRFNLLIFNKNKEGKKVRTIKWLEHRFMLFEKYCLPSVKNQTCQDFQWIVLFDSSTPERFAVDESVKFGSGIYFFRFLPRYAKTFVVRVKHRLFGWEV